MDSRGGTPLGRPAVEIAARVRAGEWSAVDVVRAHLAHIDAVDARIGAFRVVRHEAALAEAAAVDARPDRASLPLAGVPVAVKDNVEVAGEVATVGTSAHAPAPAADDHAVVARLREAGAVVVGITRVPELCIYSATDGPGTVTRNPWDTAYSSAGSSGGSAAAVAAGCVPVAHGNDGMGSLRLPAAACGLVTLKPGRGVIPAGLGADSWSGMAENGALTTTVGDLAAAFAVLAGDRSYAEAPAGGAPDRPAADRALHHVPDPRGAAGRGRPGGDRRRRRGAAIRRPRGRQAHAAGDAADGRRPVRPLVRRRGRRRAGARHRPPRPAAAEPRARAARCGRAPGGAGASEDGGGLPRPGWGGSSTTSTSCSRPS